MNEYNESMEKRKRWILSITIGCFLIIFFSQKINVQGMVLEFMDHYYHGIMTGFFPAVSKKEVTFSGQIYRTWSVCIIRKQYRSYNIAQIIRIKKKKIWYSKIIIFRMMKQRMRWSGGKKRRKVVSCKKMGKFKIFKKIYLSDRQYDNGDRK